MTMVNILKTISLIMLAFVGLVACGRKETQSTSHLTLNAKGTSEVALKVALFSPSDLSEDLVDIAAEMNAYHIKVTGLESCVSEEKIAAFSTKEVSFTTSIIRGCDYVVDIEYGNSASAKATSATGANLISYLPTTGQLPRDESTLSSEWLALDEVQALDKVYYKVTASIKITKEFLIGKNSVTILPTMLLTAEGKALGLSVTQIQGKDYKRGDPISAIDGSSARIDGLVTEDIDTPTSTVKPESPDSTTEESTANNQVTFAQISPLLISTKGNCGSCHPSYTSLSGLVANKTNVLAQVVSSKRMPPNGNGSLSDADRTLIKAWYDGGAKP